MGTVQRDISRKRSEGMGKGVKKKDKAGGMAF